MANVAYDVHEAALLDERGRRRAGVQAARFASGWPLDVMRPDLERVLRESLPPQVDLRFGTNVTGVFDDHDGGGGVRVVLGDGTHIEADLLVGADGVHSTVRRLVFGTEEQFFRYLGFHTAAFQFEATSTPRSGRQFCLTDTVGRQMGFYALRDVRVAAFAVHRTPDPALPVDVHDAVRSCYRGLGWVATKRSLSGPPSAGIYYDQVADRDVAVEQWAGRAGVGDACAAVSLLAGQGASWGSRGACLLADQLDGGALDRSALRCAARVGRARGRRASCRRRQVRHPNVTQSTRRRWANQSSCRQLT